MIGEVPAVLRDPFAKRNTVVALWNALMVTSTPAREHSYQEFSDFVRRFNQEALLFAVAQRALSLPSHLDGGRSDRAYIATRPWALAAVAKAVIC
jgi:hypothetical protein